MSDLAIIILAAGAGTRMRSTKPKVLHHLAGVPLISHVLATAEELSPAHIVAVVRHERDAVAAVIAEELPRAIIIDQDELPGTGRAVQLGLGGLPDDFTGTVVVVSGDVPLLDSVTLESLVASHELAGNALTLLSAFLPDPTGAGRIIRSSDGSFESIVEEKDATDDERRVDEVNAGVYVFELDRLRSVLATITTANAQNEMYLTDAAAGIRSLGGAIDAVPVRDHWLVAGINDRAQLSDVAVELNARIVRGWQHAGVTIQDPASTWIDLKADIAEDVEILPGTQVKGATSIGRGAIVGPDTTLVDCEVGEGAIVKRADATLAVIGANALVGPFAYLRPGTYLDEDGKIGTFVETKNSRIGRGSKVPHLSYVGDTTIGEHTNLGAGAITANYDDLTKHATQIGSHVHTGSHNVFVAPVRIGDGAKTGAGTVVRKDVPAGALAITVASQRNMVGWVEANRAGTDAAKAAAESDESPSA
jgi:bifunctional UDP-N-acetylglucosamine pyrophosphorylase/glucosamine-1-phosphate N-acetyltransferase